MFLNMTFYLVGRTIRAVSVDKDYLGFTAHFGDPRYHVFNVTTFISARYYY